VNGLQEKFAMCDTIVVGAPGESSSSTDVDGDQGDDSARDAGAVYVFTRDLAGNWSQQAYIKASNTDVGDGFGNSLGLSKNALAVGAGREQSSATGIGGDQFDNSAPLTGAAYVFQ